MKLHFVRHGETEWNVRKKIQGSADIPLNETGEQQAEQLARNLLAKKQDGSLTLEHIYTSPQLRAAKTAQAVADLLQIRCEEHAGLREMAMGEWEGRNWDDIQEHYGTRYTDWKNNRRYVPTPGGECYDEVLGRLLEALHKMIEKETGDALVVTHSAVIMVLRCYIAGSTFEEMVARYKVDNAELVTIDANEIRDAIRCYQAGK